MEETKNTREKTHHYYFEDGTELYVPYWVESATSGSFDRRWEYNWNQLKTRWVPLVLTTGRYLTPERVEPISGHVIMDNYSVYSERKRKDDAVFLRSDNEELRRKRNLCTCFFVVVGLLFVAAFLIPVLYTILSPVDTEKRELLGQYSMEVKIINLKYVPEMGYTSSPIFRQVAFLLEKEIDYLYMHRPLNKSYYGCNVTGLRNGSVIAKYHLYFRKEEEKLPPYDAVKSTLYTAERDDENKTLGKLGEYRFIIDSANVQGVNIVLRKNVDAAKRSFWADVTQRHVESTYIPTKSPTRVPQTKSPFIQSSDQATHTIRSTISITKNSANAYTIQSHKIASISEVPITKSSTTVPTTNNTKETLIRKSSSLLASSKSTSKDLTANKRTEVSKNEVSHEAGLARNSESSVVENQTEKPTTASETKLSSKASSNLQISVISTSTSATFNTTTKILIEIPKREQSFDYVKTETLTLSTTTKETTSGPTATPTLKTTTEDVSSARPISESAIELSTSSVLPRYLARSTSSVTLTMISHATESIIEDVLLSETLVVPLGVQNVTSVLEASFLTLETQKTPQISSKIPVRISSQVFIASVGSNTISAWLVEEPHSSKKSEILVTATSSTTQASWSVEETNLHSTFLVNNTNTLFRRNDKDSSIQISEDHLKEIFPQFTENVPLHAEKLYSSGSTATKFLHSSMPDIFSSQYKNVLPQDISPPISIPFPAHASSLSDKEYYSRSVLGNVEYSSRTGTFPSVQPSSILPHFHIVESAPLFTRELVGKGTSKSTVTEALSPSRTNRLLSLRRTLISKDHFADYAPFTSPESSLTESLYLSNSALAKKWRTSSKDTSPSVYISHLQNVSLKLASTMQDVSFASRLTVTETLSSYWKNIFPAVYYTPPIQDSFFVKSTMFIPESTKTETKHTPGTTGIEMPYVVKTNVATSVVDSYLIKDTSTGESTPSVKDIMKLHLESTVKNTFLKSSLIEGPFPATPSMTIVSSLEETKLSLQTYSSKISIFSMPVGYSHPTETYSAIGNKSAGTETMFESGNTTSPSTPMSLDSNIIIRKDCISYSSERQPFTTYYPDIMSGSAYSADFHPSTKRLISDSRDIGVDATVLHTSFFVASEDTVSSSFDWSERRDIGLDYTSSVLMFPPTVSLSTYNVSDLTLRGVPDKHAIDAVASQKQPGNSVIMNITEAEELLKNRSNKTHALLLRNSDLTVRLSSNSIYYYYDTESLQSSSHLLLLPVDFGQQLDTKSSQLHSSLTQNKPGFTVIQASTLHKYMASSTNINSLGYQLSSSNNIHVESDYLMQSLSPFLLTGETSFYIDSYWTSDGFQSSNNDFIHMDSSPSDASRSPGSLLSAYNNNATRIKGLNTTVDIIPTRSDWKVVEFSNGDSVQSSYMDNIGGDMYYSSIALNTFVFSPASIYNDHKDDTLSFLDTSAPSKGHSLEQKPKWSELIRPTTSKSFSSHMTTTKHQSSLSDLHISSNLYISKSSQWFTDSIVIPQAAVPLSDINWDAASVHTYMMVDWDAASVHTYMMVESVSLPHGTDTLAIKKSYSYNYESRSLIEYESKSPVFLMPWSIAKDQDYYPLTETTVSSLATPWINPVHPNVTDVLIGNESSLTNRYAIDAGLSTVSEVYITVLNRLETLISASPSKLDAPLAITDSAYSWSSVRDKWIYDSSSYENVISSATLQTRITAPKINFIDSLSNLWFVGTLETSVTGPTLLSQTTSSSLQPNASISWKDAWEAWTFDSNMETPISATSMPKTYATKASDHFISDPRAEIWSDWFFTPSSLILVSSDVPFVTSLVKSTSTIPPMSDSLSDSSTNKNFYSMPSEPLKPVVVYLTTSKPSLSVSLTTDQWADIWSEYLYDSMSITSTTASGFSVAQTTPKTSVPLSTDIWEEDIWSGWIMNSVSINPSSEFGTILTSKTLNKSASHHGNLSANILNDLTFNSLSINPTSAAVVSATPTLLNISNSLKTDPLSKMWNNWTLTLGTLGTDIGMTTGGSLGQDANDIGMGPIPSWIANILGEWAIETLLEQATSAISPSETARWARGSEFSVLPGDSLQESLTRSKMTEMANSTPVITFDEYNSSIIIGANARIACSAINVPGWSRVDVMRFPNYRHKKAELIGVITSDGTLAPGVVKNVMLNKSILYTDSFTIVMDFNHVECADEGTYMVRVFSVDTVVLEDRTKVSVQGKPSAQLSLPAEVVSGRWLLGITCKADLGYPPGRVIFQMKGLGQKEFVEFVSEYEVTNTTEITGCLTRVTYKFDDSFQPNHEWNLTTFRCAVIDTPALPPGSNMAASNEEILQFLPSDVCNWYPGLRYIPHPFDDCKRYISCPSLYILSCDPGKCFDKSSSICIQATDKQQMTTSLLNGTTSNFNNVPEKEGLPNIRFTRNAYSLYIGEIENISCTIENMRGWKTIRISRLSSRSEVEGVATVTWPEGTVVDGFFQHVSLSENSMATESGASLIVQFKNVQCSDSGTYTCTVEGDQGVMGSSSASVAVLGKPSAALFLPAEIVEGRWVLGVRCTANIGYPPGQVIWLKRGPNQKEFTTFLTKYRMYNTTTTEGCLTQVTYTFDDNFSPNIEWDFTELKCAVTDIPAIHDQSGLVVSNTEILQFVPANACDGVSVGTSLIQHPYSTCELYINCPSLYVLQCPAGKCFDTASQTCILK